VDAGTSFADEVDGLNPTAYWRLGEASGQPADSSGNGHTLSVTGSPTYGVSGWNTGNDAMTFDDSGEHLYVNDHNDWDVGTSDFSVMWAQNVASGWPSSHGHIIGHDGQGYGGEWFVRLRGGFADKVWLGLGGTDAYLTTGADMLDSGSWVFCVLTVDRSANATLYVDGTTLDSGSEYTASVSGASATDLTNTRPLRIANRSASGSTPFAGSLDEVALWNGTLLTQQNVQDLFDARDT
jgi:hypothetical protein